MKCSVAMSTYNGSAYLAEQLDSILSQTQPVDEIVISDDASSDQTLEIIRRYEAENPQISWRILLSEQNQGFRKSFRRAIMHCSGELISDFKTIDAKGSFYNERSAGENLWVSNRVLDDGGNPVRITLCEMLGRNQGQGCAMVIRSEVAREYAAMVK